LTILKKLGVNVSLNSPTKEKRREIKLEDMKLEDLEKIARDKNNSPQEAAYNLLKEKSKGNFLAQLALKRVDEFLKNN
jgi:hypothetical protein